MESLSIAGIDGTIKRRFRHTAAKKRAWMKTGTLKRVKNIGGYVKNRAGKLYTVVILINSPKAKYRGEKLQNEIIKWLAKSKAKPTVKYRSKTVQQKKRVPQKLFSNVKTSAPVHAKKMNKTFGPKYYIQTGAFSKMPNRDYLGKIETLGFRYKVHHTDSYKVLIGAYADEKGARAALQKVRAKINEGAFIVKL
jgi:D-alanyl-D-alanine carboxypeptidase/D-alanyl-D-alanine-endopeptidase (penicillin-binding protein 4)